MLARETIDLALQSGNIDSAHQLHLRLAVACTHNGGILNQTTQHATFEAQGVTLSQRIR